MKTLKLTLIICIFSIYGFSQKDADTYSMVSSSELKPVIVVQTDSPLLVENFALGRNSSGKIQSFYQLKNKSLKPIRRYSIARWYSNNTGFIGTGEMPEGDFLPGTSTTNFHGTWKLESDAKNSTNLQMIAFILVVEVVFSDGTKFDATNEFKALETHLKLLESTYDTAPTKMP